MKKLNIVFFSILCYMLFSCSDNAKEKSVYINTDSIKGSLVADTIIYDVIIKNINPDDLWKDKCLQYLNKESFIDSIFNNIYNDKIRAVEFFSGNTLSIKEVKELEESEDNLRESIGKIQFTEIWYFNSSHMIMDKKVLNMVLGAEQFNSQGELKGYKPLFRIHLN